MEVGQESSDGWLVFLWFQMSKKCLNAYLYVDQCFYSTPTERLSPFT